MVKLLVHCQRVRMHGALGCNMGACQYAGHINYCKALTWIQKMMLNLIRPLMCTCAALEMNAPAGLSNATCTSTVR